MDGRYTEAHDFDSEINKQIKVQVIWKENRQYIRLLQILEWNAATESAHTGAGHMAFQAWTVLKKKLVRVNNTVSNAGTGMRAVY